MKDPNGFDLDNRLEIKDSKIEAKGIIAKEYIREGTPIEAFGCSFMNHSCDPSCWFTEDLEFVARRDIYPGDEVTIDYAIWDSEEGYLWFDNCNCKTSFCRRVVTGDDWKLSDIQERYRGHFSPTVQRKIDALHSPK